METFRSMEIKEVALQRIILLVKRFTNTKKYKNGGCLKKQGILI